MVIDNVIFIRISASKNDIFPTYYRVLTHIHKNPHAVFTLALRTNVVYIPPTMCPPKLT